jgi:hypothetical protein
LLFFLCRCCLYQFYQRLTSGRDQGLVSC